MIHTIFITSHDKGTLVEATQDKWITYKRGKQSH